MCSWSDVVFTCFLRYWDDIWYLIILWSLFAGLTNTVRLQAQAHTHGSRHFLLLGLENSQDGVRQVILADIIVGNRGNINLGWYFCSQVLNNKTSLWYVSFDLRLPSSPEHNFPSYQTLFINGGFFVSRGLLHKNIRSPSLSSFSRKLSCIIQN